MKKLILLATIMLSFIGTQAQNPFAEYGYEPKIATLSQGQFIETFDNDTIVQIGSVLFNTKSKQIVAFVQTDTLYSEATLQPDIVSRWMSPDPLADHPTQIGLSPYHFVGNNPILWTDPDGRCPWCIAALKGAVQEYVTQVAFNVAEGKGWNSLVDVDGKEIVKSAIIDGATLGLGTLVKSGKTAIKVVNHLDEAKDAKTALTKVDDVAKVNKAPFTDEVYKRPNNATTKAQRESVQGKPCVDCGEVSTKQVADHKKPLVQEHYETGTINKEKMKSLNAVQPQCPTCSSKQGAEMSKYSKEMKNTINERKSGN